METKSNLTRQIAFKLTLGEINRFNFVQESEQGLSYLQADDQSSIFRLSVIGIIINLQKQGNITNLWLEDGTGKIIVRIFETNKYTSSLNPGDVVLIVGKVRSYNQEKYISPEIIKTIPSEWLKLRKLEFPDKYSIIPAPVTIKDDELIIQPVQKEVKPLTPNTSLEEEIISEEVVEEIEIPIEEDKELLPTQKLLLLIKEKDRGEGAKIEEVLSCSMLNDTEKLIAKMLERGDIFQNLPGRVRVL